MSGDIFGSCEAIGELVDIVAQKIIEDLVGSLPLVMESTAHEQVEEPRKFGHEPVSLNPNRPSTTQGRGPQCGQ